MVLFVLSGFYANAQLSFYRPSNLQTGDPWFLQDDGLTHLFILSADGIGHATSTDLIHWDELPMAIRKGPAGAYDEEAPWTGCTIKYNGSIYLYYCNNKHVNDRLRQGISLATSKDKGKTFTKYDGNPLFEPDPKWYYTINDPVPPFSYHARPMIDCRDLIVIKNPSAEGWLGYVVNRRKGTDAFNTACIGLWSTRDLVHWEARGPCFTPNRYNCVEVPDVFRLGSHWYMLLLTGNNYGQSNRWSDPNLHTGTIVAMADLPEGPFKEVMDDFIVIGSNSHTGALRTVERNGERMALLRRSENGFEQWGGSAWRLSLPVKLIERPGGGITSVYWPETGNIFKTKQETSDIELQADDTWKAQPLDVFSVDNLARMITASISFRGAEAAGLAFRHTGAKASDPGYAVVLDAQAGEVALVKLPGFLPLQKRRWPIRQGGEHGIRIVAVENMFDVYIDEELALMGSDSEFKSGGISLLARKGSPRFSSIECWSEKK